MNEVPAATVRLAPPEAIAAGGLPWEMIRADGSPGGTALRVLDALGHVEALNRDARTAYARRCRYCHGPGKVGERECPRCEGTGLELVRMRGFTSHYLAPAPEIFQEGDRIDVVDWELVYRRPF